MSLFAKILLYNLSLVPLYVLFMIQKFDSQNFDNFFVEYKNLIFYKNILLNNLWVLFFIFLILFSYFTYRKFVNELNTNDKLPQKFTNIKNIDFNHLTFIATYILPLLAFKIESTKDIFFLFTLLSFIGAIYIKTNLYYLSPVFVLFGIKIYEAKDEDENICILMSEKDKLLSNETLRYTDIGDIYFIKKEINE